MSNIEDILNTSNILQQMTAVAVDHNEAVAELTSISNVNVPGFDYKKAWESAWAIHNAKGEGYGKLQNICKISEDYESLASTFDNDSPEQNAFIHKVMSTKVLGASAKAVGDITWCDIGRAVMWHAINLNKRFSFGTGRKNFTYHNFKAESFLSSPAYKDYECMYHGKCKGTDQDIIKVLAYARKVDLQDSLETAIDNLKQDIRGGVIPSEIEWEVNYTFEKDFDIEESNGTKKKGDEGYKNPWKKVELELPMVRKCDSYSIVRYWWECFLVFPSKKAVREQRRLMMYHKWRMEQKAQPMREDIETNHLAMWQVVAKYGQMQTNFYFRFCDYLDELYGKGCSDDWRDCIRKDDAKNSKSIERMKSLVGKKGLTPAEMQAKSTFRKKHPAEFEQIFGVKA